MNAAVARAADVLQTHFADDVRAQRRENRPEPAGALRVPQTCRGHGRTPATTGNHRRGMGRQKPTFYGADRRDNLEFG